MKEEKSTGKEFKFFDLLEDTVFELQDFFERLVKTAFLLGLRKKAFSEILLQESQKMICRPNVFLFSSCCLLYIAIGTVLTSQFKIERGEASWLENIAAESKASFWEALVFSIIPIMILVISFGRILGMIMDKTGGGVNMYSSHLFTQRATPFWY